MTMTVSHTRIVDQDPAYVGVWMEQHGAAIWRPGATCVGWERNGQLVAGAMFDYCNGASIFAHIAVKGPITREWLWFICYYPFVQLGCTVVIGLVPSTNLAARRFDEHFAFVLQQSIRGADPTGDLCIYTLHRDDCRFLTRSPHHG